MKLDVFFYWGLGIGLILVLLGSVFFYFSINNVILDMYIIFTGLSIILGALGSTATIKYKGVTLTGMAAISIIIFSVVLSEMDDRYVRIKIRGSELKDSRVTLSEENNYLGAYKTDDQTWNFVIFGKEIKSSVTFNGTRANKTEFAKACIFKDKILPHLASGRTLEWSLQTTEEGSDILELVDVQNGTSIAKLDACNRVKKSDSKNFAMISLISTAFADPEKNNSDISSKLKPFVSRFESDIDDARREARSQVAEMGAEIVEPLLKTLSENKSSYRVKLGVLVALTEMMRNNRNPSSCEIISQQIKKEDWEQLVEASADEDRTIRIYASEFLYDLGDPKVIAFALDKIPSASENGRYNLILVIKGAIQYVADKNERDNINNKLTELKSENTPKTNELIKSVKELSTQQAGTRCSS